jgi:hypothetical protein
MAVLEMGPAVAGDDNGSSPMGAGRRGSKADSVRDGCMGIMHDAIGSIAPCQWQHGLTYASRRYTHAMDTAICWDCAADADLGPRTLVIRTITMGTWDDLRRMTADPGLCAMVDDPVIQRCVPVHRRRLLAWMAHRDESRPG